MTKEIEKIFIQFKFGGSHTLNQKVVHLWTVLRAPTILDLSVTVMFDQLALVQWDLPPCVKIF